MIEAYLRAPDERIAFGKSLLFILLHVSALGVFFVEVRTIDVVACIALYFGRMFFITAGYHRYFAHRGYKLGRAMQFVMALGGAFAAQKGALWWAGHHRHHHRFSDRPEDIHSPKRGFWWSHVGWILCTKYDETPSEAIKDFARYPELRWLNRYHLVPPVALGFTMWLLGGWSMLFVGFLLSTVLLYHGTFTINSLAHVFGTRRYLTTDTSRNSLLLSLITLGEGWHNNHHYYQSTANQGFFWWELDPSYYVLKVLSWLGLAHDLRTPSAAVLARNRLGPGVHDVGMLGELPSRAAALREEASRLAGAARDAANKVAEQAKDATEPLAGLARGPGLSGADGA